MFDHIFTLILAAEEAAEVVAETVAPVSEAAAPTGVVGWILATALPLIAAAILGLLKKRWDTENVKLELDATKSLMEQRNFIIDQRLIPFAISSAEHWTILHMPAIVGDLKDGGDFRWGEHFDNLKNYTKDRVLKKFAAENLDIIEFLGEKELDNLLDRLLLKLITKLPESVQAFIPNALVTKLTDYASAYITEKGKDLLGLDEAE